MSSRPTISAIIVNWNHGAYLESCLEALCAQQGPDLEVVVVDNASTDGSVQKLSRHASRARLLRMSENVGFSRAFNSGVKAAGGQYMLSLNPDVFVRPGFLSALVDAMEADPRIGSAAPKLLRADDPAVLDSTGLFVDRRRRTYDRGQGQMDAGQYDRMVEVFGACGAAAIYRRTMLDDVAIDGQFLDERFFAYYEDADLAWRAGLRGWRCVFVPTAVCEHVRGWGDTLRKRGHARKAGSGPRLALRNRYLMTIRNDTLGHFLLDLPWIVTAEIPRLAYAAMARPLTLMGLLDLIAAAPDAVRKRQYIRASATVDDGALRHWFVERAATAAQSGGAAC
ncbi:MAG: glycosyltransferase family 2 protein [Chloroflexi bacterium]|nr:glycosyltransferase family 2 protein [Chloroflexota bacterium]